MRVTAPQLRTVLLAQAIEHADSGHTLVSPPALEEATRSAVAAARARGVQRVAEWGPDVVVLDLFLKASHSRESAAALQSRSVTRDIPIVFVDGLPGVVAKALAQVKGATAVSSFDLSSAVNDLVPEES